MTENIHTLEENKSNFYEDSAPPYDAATFCGRGRGTESAPHHKVNKAVVESQVVMI